MHEALMLHTVEPWLFQVNTLVRFFELQAELIAYLIDTFYLQK